MTRHTRVASARTLTEWPDDAVYVGRPVSRSRFAQARAGSPLGNPYRAGPDGTLAEVLARYRGHVLSRPDLLALLPPLKGRTLVCWCVDCEAPVLLSRGEYVCHAQVLADLIDGGTAAAYLKGGE